MNHLNKFHTNENRKPFTAPKSMKRPIYSQMNLYITNKLAKYLKIGKMIKKSPVLYSQVV